MLPGAGRAASGRDIARQWPWLLLFALLFALACLTRSRQIRDLVLPNWVDSVHHTMIVRLIVEQGRLPATYAPYIPEAGFSYHWGFHAWVAWLAWLLGVRDSFELAHLLLLFGQVLNVLMLWMLYAAGRTLFNSRRAGFVTASLGMFVSWLPAYYTAWGRYTHLGGLLLAIPFLICLWRLGRAQDACAGLAGGDGSHRRRVGADACARGAFRRRRGRLAVCLSLGARRAARAVALACRCAGGRGADRAVAGHAVSPPTRRRAGAGRVAGRALLAGGASPRSLGAGVDAGHARSGLACHCRAERTGGAHAPG